MESSKFLVIDDHSINLNQAIAYLQESGKLGSFIGAILQQYVLEQELKQCDAISIQPEQIDQTIQTFRSSHQLTEVEHFQQWLAQNGMSHEYFQRKVEHELKMNQLIPYVAEPKLQERFINRKLFLDRVILSRLVVTSQELAEELKSQVIEENSSFAQLVYEHSIADDYIINGRMEPISRGDLPDALRSQIDLANVGEIVGPLKLEGHWYLFRVEAMISASLADESLKHALQTEIFNDWIAEKIQSKQVQLYLN